MQKILITGVNGFLAKNLLEFLKEKYFIIGLDVQGTAKFKDVNKYYQIDITDSSKLSEIKEDIDFIIHLVALTNPQIEKSLMYKVNVQGTQNICEFAKLKKINKIIYLSTVSIYAENREKIITEETPTAPINYYGVTKLSAEEIIQKSGITYTILRPTNIFGEDREDYKKYFERIKTRGKRFGIIFYRQRITHLVYVKDVCAVIKECLENSKQTNNEIFIVADNENEFTEKKIFSELIRYFKLNKRLLPHPFFWSNTDNRIFSAAKLKKIYDFKYGVLQGIYNCLK